MTALTRSLALAALPLGLLLSSTGALAQAEDLAIPLTSCTPNTSNSLGKVVMNAAQGYVRANNATAGTVIYTCNLLDSYVNIVPLWTRIGLQYRDATGGRINFTLYAKNKLTGVSGVVATFVPPASVPLNNVSVPIPVLNYAANSYYAVVRILSDAVQPPEAHLVRVEQ